MSQRTEQQPSAGCRLVRLAETDRPGVTIFHGERTLDALAGDTLLTALLCNGVALRRNEFDGDLRAGFCNMGACQDCWVVLEGREPHPRVHDRGMGRHARACAGRRVAHARAPCRERRQTHGSDRRRRPGGNAGCRDARRPRRCADRGRRRRAKWRPDLSTAATGFQAAGRRALRLPRRARRKPCTRLSTPCRSASTIAPIP